MKSLLVPLVLCLAGCAAVGAGSSTFDPQRAVPPPPVSQQFQPSSRPAWVPGQPLMQGFFGVSFYDEIKREGGSTPDVESDGGGIEQMPLLGGGAQWKVGGENLDYGFEGFFSLEGRANAEAFAVGGGGVAIAVDVDLLLWDMYGGFFISKFLGDTMRIYGGIGPLLQFADYHQDWSASHASGSGFGVGGYVRTGIEFLLPSRTLVGLGARWSDSTIDLSNGLGDLKMEGYQVYLTISRGI